jgi:arginase family enzyme
MANAAGAYSSTVAWTSGERVGVVQLDAHYDAASLGDRARLTPGSPVRD